MPAPLDLLPTLLAGLWTTLVVTAGGALLALVTGFAAGLGRLSSMRPVRIFAALYVETFRGTSALVQLFWVFFALPFFGIEMSPLAAGVLVLGLNIGAYGAEVVRGVVRSVPIGQWEAARALSLSHTRTLWRVIIPQAMPTMVPPAGNLLIELLKGTALVSLVSLADLTFAAQTLRADTLRTPEIFTLVLLLYYAVAVVLNAGTRGVERRLSVWRGGAGV